MYYKLNTTTAMKQRYITVTCSTHPIIIAMYSVYIYIYVCIYVSIFYIKSKIIIIFIYLQ